MPNGMFASSVVCKKERGYLSAFRIVVKEDRIENSLYTASVDKDPHRPGSPFDFLKSSLDKVRGANPSPQGLLSFLKLLNIETPSLFWTKFYLIKRKQIINL